MADAKPTPKTEAQIVTEIARLFNEQPIAYQSGISEIGPRLAHVDSLTYAQEAIIAQAPTLNPGLRIAPKAASELMREPNEFQQRLGTAISRAQNEGRFK